jgi:hypothetical protein
MVVRKEEEVLEKKIDHSPGPIVWDQEEESERATDDTVNEGDAQRARESGGGRRVTRGGGGKRRLRRGL